MEDWYKQTTPKLLQLWHLSITSCDAQVPLWKTKVLVEIKQLNKKSASNLFGLPMVLNFLYWEAREGKLPLIAFKILFLKKETASSELPFMVNDRNVSLYASVASLLQSDTDVIVSVALDSMSCTK